MALESRIQTQTDVSQRRAQSGATERCVAEDFSCTIGDVISRYQAVLAHEEKGSPLFISLSAFQNALHSLVDGAGEHPHYQPSDQVRDLKDLPELYAPPMHYGETFCLANHYANSHIALFRVAGRRMHQANHGYLAIEVREAAHYEQTRANFIASCADMTKVANESHATLSHALKLARDKAPDRATVRNACDTLRIHMLRYGSASQDREFFPGECRLTPQAFGLFTHYGEMVAQDFRGVDTHEKPAIDVRDDQHPLTLAAGMEAATQRKADFFAFLSSPSLEHWNNLAGHIEQGVVEALVDKNYHALGQSMIVLDPATQTFREMMRMITAGQQRLADERHRAEQLADELMATELTGELPAMVSKAKKKHKHTAGTAKLPSKQQQANPTEHSPVSLDIRKRIYAAAQSKYGPVSLEGMVAKDVLENLSVFAEIIGFNQKIAGDHRSLLGELDLHLDNAIVECTLQTRGKERQLSKYVNNHGMNPNNKAVILYGEQYRGKVPLGVLHARTPDQLADMLFALKVKQLGLGD